MSFWSDNISNVSDEELGKDELFLDNILAKDLSMPKRSPWSQDGGTGTGDGQQELDLSRRSAKLSCMVGDGDPAMLEDLVDPKKSGKEKRLLNIFRTASRATDHTDGRTSVDDLEVGSMADIQAHFEEEHTEHLSKTSLREERNPFTEEDKNGPITTKVSKVRTTKKNATRKLFPCVVCKKKFSLKTNMKTHVRKIHFAKVVSCSLCNKQVKEAEVAKHIAKYHSD